MTTVKTEIGVHKRQAHHTRFSPTGNIESTDVQRAIEEVSTDSAPSDGTYYVASANANLSAEIVVPAFMQSVLDDTTQGAARTTLGVGAADNPDFAGLFLTEKAAAEADVAGSGQFWVQTATPNLAMFTDDAGTDFSLANFEDLASNSNSLGASLIGIEDSAGNFTATDVEAALAEIYSDFASTANALGASLIGIEDASGLVTATTVEGALAENRTAIDAIEADYLTSSDIGSTVQAYDADLDTWALLTPSANFQTLVPQTFAQMRSSLDLEAGTDFYSITGADAAFQPLDSDLTAIAALSTTSFGRGLLESASASALYGAIKQTATEGATGAVEWATTAEVRAANAASDQVIRARSINEASALVTLTDAATVAIDWTAGINFTLTLTTNRILGNPTNEIPGTWRTVFVISDGGPDTLTFGSEYGGAPPTLDDITTTKGYLLSIYCRAAGQFLVFSADGSPA